MLQLRTCDNGVVCLISPVLESAGIPHAFSTRVGGVSIGPFASLNLGNPQGALRDSEANLHENHLRLFEGLRLTGRRLCRVHQVHGHEIVALRPGDAPPADRQADALLTDAVDLTLSIRTADCVPILIGETSGRIVAAVHAGWRGVIAGIVPRTITAMKQMGVPESDLLLAIGPCIGPDAFEVGDEVAEEFSLAFGGDAPILRSAGRKPHVDLPRAVWLQACQAGLRTGQIDRTDHCTFRDATLFFSHRRDSGVTGRMASVISPRGK